MAGIGGGVLEGDIFIGERADYVGTTLADGRNGWRFRGGDGSLVRRRAMVRVFQDA